MTDPCVELNATLRENGFGWLAEALNLPVGSVATKDKVMPELSKDYTNACSGAFLAAQVNLSKAARELENALVLVRDTEYAEPEHVFFDHARDAEVALADMKRILNSWMSWLSQSSG